MKVEIPASGHIPERWPTFRYLMLTSPIEGTPTDGAVLVLGEYLGLPVVLE